MKSLTLRSSVAFALALSLAGCGGSGNLMLGGQVTGLFRDHLVLKNKGGPALTIESANGSSQTFSFPELLRSDEDFEVTIAEQPASASCVVTNGKGRTGSFSITNVYVTCTTFTHALGGTIAVSGATQISDIKGLVLINGLDRVAVPDGAATFAMSKVGEYSNYGVTILTQPDNHTCTVENGVGTMGATDVSNIKINCI